jgi:hypothetical protein
MPRLHRWLGNPVLSFLGRLFFRVPVSDFHCGIRGFRKEAVKQLGLRTTGMEFASKMVVKASLFGLRIAEIPVTLRPDGRSRPPHLRTWQDGWRHLRFLLIYSPRWLYLVPGLLFAVGGCARKSPGFIRSRSPSCSEGGCSSLHDFSRASDWNNEPHEFGLGTLGMYLAAMNKFPEARRFQEQATRLNLRRG